MEQLTSMLMAAPGAWLARLVDVSLRATVVLLAAGGLSLVMRRASAATRHLVWTAAIGGVLLLPVVAAWMPTLAVPILTPAPSGISITGSTRTSAIDDEVPPQSGADAAQNAPMPAGPAGIDPATMSRTSEDRASSSLFDTVGRPAPAPAPGFFALMFRVADAAIFVVRTLPALALLLWVTGALALLARLASGVARVSWITRRAAPAGELVARTASELSRMLGLTRPVAVLTSAATEVPMTWGWARAIVLLPADAAAWSADRLRVVLLHELSHVKRSDWATQLIAQIACAVYWFNPFVWLAARRQRIERERACDAAVLSAGTCASSYATHLLEIARSRMKPSWSSLPAVAMARQSQLEGRLLAILDPRTRSRTATRVGACLAGVATVGVVLLLAAVEPSARATPASEQERGQAAGAVVPGQMSTPAPRATGGSGPAPPQAATPAREAAEPASQGTRESAGRAPRSGIIAGAVEEALKALGQVDFEGEIAKAVRAAREGLRDVRVDLKGVDLTDLEGLIETEVETAIEEAERALSSMGLQRPRNTAPDDKLIDAFLVALQDSDAEVRERAAWALGKERAVRAVDALGGALKDADPDVREQAAWALGQIRDKRSIDPLSGALRDESAEVAEQAAWALGQIRDPSAVPGLLAGISHADPDVREQIAWALGQIRDPRAIDGLIGLLNDPEPDVREQAAWALGQIRDAAAVDGLVAALDDEDADVREQIVWALGQIRDGRAVPGLLAALKDSEPDVVEQVVWALGRMRDERAKEALIEALQHEDPEVRRRVIDALTGGNWDPQPQPQPEPDPRPGAWKLDGSGHTGKHQIDVVIAPDRGKHDAGNPNPNVDVNVNKNVNSD